MIINLKKKYLVNILLLLILCSVLASKSLINKNTLAYELNEEKTNEYGAFVVGEDIKPGTYKFNFSNDGAVHISKSITDIDTLDSGVSLETIESDSKINSKIVVLEEYSILTLDPDTEVKLMKVER